MPRVCLPPEWIEFWGGVLPPPYLASQAKLEVAGKKQPFISRRIQVCVTHILP